MTAVPPRPAADRAAMRHGGQVEPHASVPALLPPDPAAPDATAGDGLREEVAAWLFRKVIHRDGLIKLQWEHLVEPQITGWLEWADELLALPALRDVLAAAARDAEKVRRVEELLARYRYPTREGLLAALDPS